MGASWLGLYIPEDEEFVAPPKTLEWIVNAFSGFAEPICKVDTTLDERGRIVSLYLTQGAAEPAAARLFGDDERMPVSLCAEEYPTADPWEDDFAQRVCGACGARCQAGLCANRAASRRIPRIGR